MAKKILVTGRPGVGKTTLIKQICEGLKDLRPVGFYTAEIREAGVRKGFELVGLDGEKRLLSHTRIKAPYRVGRYGVDVEGFDEFLRSIPFMDPATRLIIIDEIGKMESFSEIFKNTLLQVMDSEKPVVATVAQKAGGFIEAIKKRREILLLTMTEKNRDLLRSKVMDLIRQVRKNGE